MKAFNHFFAISIFLLGSLSSYGQKTLTIDITKDATVLFTQGTTDMDNNYGSVAKLNAVTGTSGSAPKASRTFIEIDLSSLAADISISTATLKLKFDSADTTSGSNECNLHKVETSWGETTITWNNQPSYTVDVNDPYIPKTTGATDYDVDLTDWVKESYKRKDNSLSFILKLITEVPGQYRKYKFGSSDNATASLRPKLEVVYYENEIFLHSSSTEPSEVYDLTDRNIHVKTGMDYLFKSSLITYEIKDQYNATAVSSTSSNLTSDIDYIEIDVSAQNLNSGETYTLILKNSEGQKQYLKFRPQ